MQLLHRIPPPPAAQPTLDTFSTVHQVLGLSWLYYYAQRSGKLSNVYNPIPWRGDSHVNDSVVGAPHGEDSPLLHLVSLH